MQMILPGARSNKGHLVPRGGGGKERARLALVPRRQD